MKRVANALEHMMLHHIEFCLDEIDVLLVETVGEADRDLLKSKVADIRSLIGGWTFKPLVATTDETVAEIVPAATVEIADDLTLIRGIDAEIAAILGGTHFATVASWRAVDIAALDRVIPAHRIAQQNWIEQAAILATGRLTAHAIRVTRGDFACLVASPEIEQSVEAIAKIDEGEAKITEGAKIEKIEIDAIKDVAEVPTLIVASSCWPPMLDGSPAVIAEKSQVAKPEVQTAEPPAIRYRSVISLEKVAELQSAATAVFGSDRRWGRRVSFAATLILLMSVGLLGIDSKLDSTGAPQHFVSAE